MTPIIRLELIDSSIYSHNKSKNASISRGSTAQNLSHIQLTEDCYCHYRTEAPVMTLTVTVASKQAFTVVPAARQAL
jgi:hypothetical protein